MSEPLHHEEECGQVIRDFEYVRGVNVELRRLLKEARDRVCVTEAENARLREALEKAEQGLTDAMSILGNTSDNVSKEISERDAAVTQSLEWSHELGVVRAERDNAIADKALAEKAVSYWLGKYNAIKGHDDYCKRVVVPTEMITLRNERDLVLCLSNGLHHYYAKCTTSRCVCLALIPVSPNWPNWRSCGRRWRKRTS